MGPTFGGFTTRVGVADWRGRWRARFAWLGEQRQANLTLSVCPSSCQPVTAAVKREGNRFSCPSEHTRCQALVQPEDKNDAFQIVFVLDLLMCDTERTFVDSFPLFVYNVFLSRPAFLREYHWITTPRSGFSYD